MPKWRIAPLSYMCSITPLKGVYSVSHGSNWISTTEGVRKQPKWNRKYVYMNIAFSIIYMYDYIIYA